MHGSRSGSARARASSPRAPRPASAAARACELGGLAVGAIATVVLVLHAPAGQPLTLGAAATSAAGDPTPADATVSVERPALAGPVRTASRLRASVTTQRTIVAGGRVRVRGRLLANGPVGGRQVRITVASRWWPGLVRSVSARTDAGGRFAASVAPVASGAVSVRFAGSAQLASSSATAGAVALRPRIQARFHGARTGGSAFVAVRATGRFAPARAGEGARLAWQARRGGRWVRIGGERDAVRVHHGRLSGVLRLGPLRAENRYRLVYEPLGRAPLARGTSAGALARAR